MKSFKSTIIYLISSLIEKGMAFLLIPIYTHYLSTADYGILTIVQSMIAILIIFFTLSLNGAASRYHFDGKWLYRKIHYGNLFLSVTIISIIVGVLFYFSSDIIFKLIGNVPKYPYIYFIFIITYGSAIFGIYQLKLQMEQRAVEYGINNILKFLIASLIAIYLVVYLHKKADGILLGQSVAFIIFLLYIAIRLKKENIKFNLYKKFLKRNIKYSINLVPHNIAGILMQFLDRFFISNMINLSHAGVYALGGQISSILGVVASAINNATVPVVLKAYKEKNYKLLIDLANISIVVLVIGAIILSLFSSEIITIISPKSYEKASIVLSTLSFYFVIQMYYFMTSSVLFYEEKATKFVPVATVLSLIFNFIFNYFFIKELGMLGAAIATLLSLILVNYIVIFIADKYIKVGFEHLKIHFYIIVGFVAGNSNIFFKVLIYEKILILLLVMSFFYLFEKNNLLLKELKV